MSYDYLLKPRHRPFPPHVLTALSDYIHNLPDCITWTANQREWALFETKQERDSRLAGWRQAPGSPDWLTPWVVLESAGITLSSVYDPDTDRALHDIACYAQALWPCDLFYEDNQLVDASSIFDPSNDHYIPTYQFLLRPPTAQFSAQALADIRTYLEREQRLIGMQRMPHVWEWYRSPTEQSWFNTWHEQHSNAPNYLTPRIDIGHTEINIIRPLPYANKVLYDFTQWSQEHIGAIIWHEDQIVSINMLDFLYS